MKALLLLIGCFSIATTNLANAKEGTPDSDSPRCKEATDLIVRKTGAEFESVSKDGSHVYFRHPLAKDMSLDCAEGWTLTLFIASNAGAFPPASFYQLAGVAGAIVTKGNANSIRIAAERTHLLALKETKFNQADIVLKNKIHVGSTALTNDGGFSSVSINIEN